MQVKSKQRVADHGEVYTNEREVNAMLDLVKDQAENPEKTFLEPACGTGNFLAEILRRKLNAVAAKYRKVQSDYERTAVIAVGSIYGIELLHDNVQECRDRLYHIAEAHYQNLYPKSAKTEYLNAIRYVLAQNILHGDALSLKTAEGKDIVFAEWKPAFGNKIQRRDFIYGRLMAGEDQAGQLSFFSDLGEKSLIFEPHKDDYPLMHYWEVGHV